ncbi:Aste57867_3035 [Aphanomyces stellatus]|uniref:Aste57867_3035 protein n=1 Tax=Aphanomyces stellatus TaxID=120398 RepID=A0A485K9J2_9STRA|nr:hypothetical protein As57867_003026 [Aphanomyces stellatus]VFT80215.1 Aste57867_3035 [Aphanomyces stellatus]
MGFRGIFLERSADGDEGRTAKFQIACAQSELCLLIERQVTSDIDPTGVVDAKVLVKNTSTGDLLSVARMADVTLEVSSMFWILGSSVHCFRFESDNSFAEVRRAVQSLRRTEQLALMRSTLSLHPLHGDVKTNAAMWKHYSNCAKLDQPSEEPVAPRPQAAPKRPPSSSQALSKRAITPKKKERVVVKEEDSTSHPPPKKRKDGGTTSDKPVSAKAIEAAKAFNTQYMTVIDPKQPSSGPGCHVCQRRQGKLFHCPNGVADHVYCGRCIFYRFKLNVDDFFKRGVHYSCRLCSHECDCTACSRPGVVAPSTQPPPLLPACLLCGTTDAALLQPHPHLPPHDALHMLCQSCLVPVQALPNDSHCRVCGDTPDDVAPCESCTQTTCATCRAKFPHLAPPHCPLCATPVEPSSEPINPHDGLSYLASYVQFLVHRETRRKLPKLSEDSCFCCKDGGMLIECDYKAEASAPRCPKVYHVDCLGFDVPDDVTWHCPRHKCGFKCSAKSKFVCRFCALACCEKHLPKDATKLFPAPPDPPATTYIACATCVEQLELAEGRGLLVSEFYKTPVTLK